MLLINFAHPLTDSQKSQLEEILGAPLEQVIDVVCKFDNAMPFAEQVEALVDQLGLSPRQWQNDPIVINPPSFSPIACCLLAELHGRMGYFPPIVRMRPVSDGGITRFEVAEVISLHEIRQKARAKRPGTNA